ncbi:DUF7310 family coiled-coil domain-containing protein [Halorubrum laminariae]|uniref:DUF7310 domain-containing protein n=1 Tax=Halorubrum laminariae TaxID=1433523 RepID=A0ABD6BZK0_9EURY|nr:hypothetical protein [Halorubrum laminariae]
MTDTTRSDDRGIGDDEATAIDERLRAVERALTGSDAAVADIADGAEATAERRAIGSRLTDLETRVEELEAATQALRGYAGAVRAVNTEVERRADLALARASRERDREDAHAGQGSDPDSDPIDEGTGERPTASALDAAVPFDSTSGGSGHRLGEDREYGGTDETGTADERGRTGTGGTAGSGSWSRETLTRLRESL